MIKKSLCALECRGNTLQVCYKSQHKHSSLPLETEASKAALPGNGILFGWISSWAWPFDNRCDWSSPHCLRFCLLQRSSTYNLQVKWKGWKVLCSSWSCQDLRNWLRQWAYIHTYTKMQSSLCVWGTPCICTTHVMLVWELCTFNCQSYLLTLWSLSLSEPFMNSKCSSTFATPSPMMTSINFHNHPLTLLYYRPPISQSIQICIFILLLSCPRLSRRQPWSTASLSRLKLWSIPIMWKCNLHFFFPFLN